MFKKLALRAKIIIGFVIIFLFALILGAVGIVSNFVLQKNSSDQVFIEEANASALSVVNAHRDWLQKLSNTVYTEAEFTGSVDPTTCAFGKWEQTDYAKIDDEKIQSLIEQIKEPHSYIHHEAETIVKMITEGKHEEAQTAYESEIVPRMNTTLSLLMQVDERYTEMTEVYEQSMKQTQTTLMTIEYVLLALSAVFSVLLAVMIIKSIMRPIRDVTKAAEKLSVGDLDVACDYSINDEIGQLNKAMKKMIDSMRQQAIVMESLSSGDLTVEINARSEADTTNIAIKTMLENLNNMFRQIQMSTSQVSTGANQVADGAQALASGATEQTASIEELSRSISEMSERSKQNAEMAGKAADLAGTIKGNAEKGSNQMDEMITAVNDINQSSHEISKVIKVIDDIAFQTNILALNAAVEAARAGQHGKGFAVVAEEVRNLAAKSAEAAKDTERLIANSMEKAQFGVRIAGETSTSLTEIVSGINESSVLISEIAHSSEAQSLATSHIDTGISQVSQVVQQNTATAEESAAASQEMSGQSALLQQLISQFRLKDENTMHSGLLLDGSHQFETPVDSGFELYDGNSKY